MKGLKSGAVIKMELGQNISLTPAGKLQLITELLGDQPIYDDEDNEIGRTPKLITEEQARKILGME